MLTGDAQSHEQVRAGYVGAVDHYTSPQRRDAVKRLWEEPELVGVLNDALARTANGTTRVLDVGCGTAVALQLLRQTATYRNDAVRRLQYVGVDLDEKLLAVATDTIRPEREGETVTFSIRDIRDGAPDRPHDLLISTGVPFSHLTPDELSATLRRLFADVRDTRIPLVAVIDVLGRYSLEWTRMWPEERWSYRMSFFATDQDADATDMTTYDGDTLRNMITSSAAAAGVSARDITLTDRSIMVGRHTMTGEYTPGLPQWRAHMNALHDNQSPCDLAQLQCTLELPDAPPQVDAFFTSFLRRWNDTVAAAQHTISRSAEPEAWRHVQAELFGELLTLEHHAQPGLGVGHSLTAVVVVTPV